METATLGISVSPGVLKNGWEIKICWFCFGYAY